MTGRERLINIFKRKKVDRVPVCPWLHVNIIYKYFNVAPEEQNWRKIGDIVLPEMALEAEEHFGIDHFYRSAYPRHQCDEKSSSDGKWIVNAVFKKINGRDTEITTIKTPEKELRQVKEFDQTSRFTYIEAIREYFIKEKGDFDQFVKYQPSFDEAIYPAIIDEFMGIDRAKKAFGDKGIIVGEINGAFNSLNVYRNLELIMMDPYTDPGFYKAMIEYFSNRSISSIRKMVKHGADVIEMAGNLATSCVGEKFFSSFVLEHERAIAEEIKKLGAYSLYHNCGDAAKIMHLYNDMGIDAWGYMTPPPYGDVDFDTALKVINKDIILMGNIDQVNFLIKATPKQVKKKVRETLEKIKERGNFILSTTDWCFDDTPFENIVAFAEAGIKYGKY